MLTYRFATAQDIDTYFNWANDEDARNNSYNQVRIAYEDHVKWFNDRLTTPGCRLYVFMNEQAENVGQVRVEQKDPGQAIISISVDAAHRRKGYSAEMLSSAVSDFIAENPGVKILAYIFKRNESSYKSFLKAGFRLEKELFEKGIDSFLLTIE